jgi:hypothetical protein
MQRSTNFFPGEVCKITASRDAVIPGEIVEHMNAPLACT